MRRAAFVAAVGTALAIPGLVRAGDPQLLLEARPAAPIVLSSAGRSDALLSLEARNSTDHAVRVERLRLIYLEGARTIATVDPATFLFTDAGLLSDPRVEPGATAAWANLCLSPPTAATDHARLELDLVSRHGMRNMRAKQVLDVPFRRPGSPPAIALPVQGAWRVTQGHTCETAHRRSPLGSEFAWDLAAVDDERRPPGSKSASSHRDDPRLGFGRPVTAPIAGRVSAAFGDADDNVAGGEAPTRSIGETMRDPLWYFGNYVVIEGPSVSVLLAHLRKGSLSVKKGDTVREGDPIGTVGNSGRTVDPHLHVQVMDRPDPADPAVAGVPAVFRDYLEASTRGEGPDKESVVRRVSAGDPPSGAVIRSASPPVAATPQPPASP